VGGMAFLREGLLIRWGNYEEDDEEKALILSPRKG